MTTNNITNSSEEIGLTIHTTTICKCYKLKPSTIITSNDTGVLLYNNIVRINYLLVNVKIFTEHDGSFRTNTPLAETPILIQQSVQTANSFTFIPCITPDQISLLNHHINKLQMPEASQEITGHVLDILGHSSEMITLTQEQIIS